jgi:subtilase family serine protease
MFAKLFDKEAPVMLSKNPLLHLVAPVATFITLMSILIGTSYFDSANVPTAYAAQGVNVPWVYAAQSANVPAVQAFSAHLMSKAHLSFTRIRAALKHARPGAAQFSCQNSGASPRCYSPAQIQHAYNVTPLLGKGINGQGSTIVIVDAYQSPTLINDVQTFNQLFNLSGFQLTVVAPFGLTPFNPHNTNQVGWAAEITLDVEWAHAIAPGASIVLALAKSSMDTDLFNVTQYAVTHNLGDVLSQSFGEAESCANPSLLKAEHTLFQQAVAQGMTLIAGTGDFGAAQQNCNGHGFMLSAGTPASDTLVTAVGGTSLNANANSGAYISETAWNDHYGASGGGFSTLYKRPGYQKGINTYGGHTGRGIPDVAYDGDVNTGVLVVFGSNGPNSKQALYVVGGTSAGTPQWAALVALADQVNNGRIGFINGGLYALGRSSAYATLFHDITSGNNTFMGIQGYNALTGWDAVTGWGTPNAYNLILGKQNIIAAAKANPPTGL